MPVGAGAVAGRGLDACSERRCAKSSAMNAAETGSPGTDLRKAAFARFAASMVSRPCRVASPWRTRSFSAASIWRRRSRAREDHIWPRARVLPTRKRVNARVMKIGPA